MSETELQKTLRETNARWTATDKPMKRTTGLKRGELHLFCSGKKNLEHEAMLHELEEEEE